MKKLAQNSRSRHRNVAEKSISAEPAHSELSPVLKSMRPVKILVVGEVILDRYLWGEANRISPEAPIPILKLQKREERPGNAGFVMANLRALGAKVSALSIIGADRNGQMLREILGNMGIDTRSILTDPERPTIVKERLIGSVQSANRAMQQLLRVDEEDTHPLSAAINKALRARVKQELKHADGVLVSDINKGLLTSDLLSTLIEGARSEKIPVFVDPRLCDDFSIYRNATAITPNRYEAEQVTGMRLTDRESWREASEKLVKMLGLEACLITLDKDGMYLAQRSGEDIFIPTSPREVYDVTGAGDVVLAVFGLMASAGLSFASAATLANFAAGIEVTRIGTEVISREDLTLALNRQVRGWQRKVLAMNELVAVLDGHRRKQQRVVFTNGCFDLLHAGHVESLEFAKSQGDILVVAVNSDRSVRAIKGTGRPVYSANERARLLAALETVDYVVVFDEERAENIIRSVRPDVLVKGDDWRGKTVDGARFIEEYGGRVAFAPLLAGHSTSATLQKLKSEPDGRKQQAES